MSGYEIVREDTGQVVDYAPTWSAAASRASYLTGYDRTLHVIRPVQVLQNA